MDDMPISILSPIDVMTLLHARSGKKKKKPKDNTIAVNHLAYHSYEIIDTLEVGISLKGSEVKLIWDGKMNLRDGYNRIKVQIALCKGKNVRDKWQTVKEQDAKRDEQWIIKNFWL